MVTASHNPQGDNGFKICREGVRPIGGNSGLKEIEASCQGEPKPPLETLGAGKTADIWTEYLDHVIKLSQNVCRQAEAFVADDEDRAAFERILMHILRVRGLLETDEAVAFGTIGAQNRRQGAVDFDIELVGTVSGDLGNQLGGATNR